MKRGLLVAGGCFLALFAATIYLSAQLPFLDALGPGPGFFPMALAVLGAGLSAVMIGQNLRQPVAENAEPLLPDSAARLRILGVLSALAIAAALLEPAGYRIAAAVFTTMTLLVLGIRNPVALVLFALGAGPGVFYVFYYWLKVPLPIGMFGY